MDINSIPYSSDMQNAYKFRVLVSDCVQIPALPLTGSELFTLYLDVLFLKMNVIKKESLLIRVV